MKLRTLMSVAAVLQAVGTFASPSWTFTPAGASVSDGSAGTIASSDGVWELKVLIVKASDKTLSIGSKPDSTQAGGGHAFVRGSGDLDLRGAVTRANTSEAWKIVNLNWGSLGRGASTGFVSPGSLYAPTTLKAMNRCFACTDSCYQSFTNVVVDAPDFNKLYERVFTTGVNTNLDRLVFRAPALTEIPNNGFSYSNANPDDAAQPKLWGSSYDEWDLTGVTSVGDAAFLGRHIHGTLNLPKVRTIGMEVFYNCTNDTKVLLSPDLKTLTRIGSKAFFQEQWGSNRYVTDSTLKEIVLGGASGFTIMTNAFKGQLALSSVSFTGAKPTYAIKADGIVFGGSNAAKSMAFYVPDNEEWADVIALATPATDAEKAAWASAHPDYLPIWGVVPASAFHTQNDQYIGFYAKRVSKPKFFFDERFGDNVTFESLGPWPAASDGTWPTNNTFRITVTVGEGGSFTRWYGDMPKDLCGQQTLEVSGDRLVDVRWLLPRITHPWTLDTSTKTIGNGIWKLHIAYASSTTLTLGNTESGTWGEVGRALTGTGSGYLDVGGAITDGSGNRYTIANVQGGHDCLGSTSEKAGPTVFVSPGTLRGAFFNYQHFGSSSADESKLEALVVDEPGVTSGFSNGWLLGGTNVRYLQLLIPSVPSIDKNAFNRWSGSTFELNFSLCDFSSVTNVGEQAFYFCRAARGELDLPSAKIIGPYAFSGCANLQAVYLATNRHEAVSEIASGIFVESPSVEKLVLNLAANATWPSSVSTLREVWFVGPPPTRTSLGNMLGALPETTGAKACVVYVSRNMGEWSSLASAPTAEELATFPGDAGDLLGVFRKDPSASPTKGVAWIVNRASPWDPKGLLLFIR